MIPRRGLNLPTIGFSVWPENPVKSFLEDRNSRGLSDGTIRFYRDYLEWLQSWPKQPVLPNSPPSANDLPNAGRPSLLTRLSVTATSTPPTYLLRVAK